METQAQTEGTTPVKPSPSLKEWAPCLTLAVAAFVFNTTEFAPIALLSDIARDLSVSNTKAGLLITIYAWVVALASLPLILVFGKMERRKLMIWLLITFIVSHIVSWQSFTYHMLLVSRIMIAFSHAIFWSIAAPMAVKLAPEGHRSAGLGIMATGSALATILGLPFGRTIGLYLGWQTTFLCIGCIAILVLALMIYVLPTIKNKDAESFKSLPLLLKSRALMGLYLFTALIVTTHFTGYTYIEPFMIKIAGLSENVATISLLIFGAAGIVGNVIFSRFNEKKAAPMTAISIICITISLLLMIPSSISTVTVFLLCVFWGVSTMIFNLIFQDRVIRIAPYAPTVAMSIYSGIYNIGIGSGAIIGGTVNTHADIRYVGIAGFSIGILALAFYFLYLRRFLFAKK